MRRACHAAIVVAVLGGCGGEETGAQPPTSGARLKLRWFAFADGTRLPLTDLVHDELRDEDCAPTRWDDGVERCTPPTFVLDENRFADAGCTQPASGAPERAGYGVYTSGTDDNAVIRALFHVEPAAIDRLWFRDELGTCRGPTTVSGGVHIVAEVPRTELAEVAYTMGPASGRIAIGAYEDVDGLYMPAAAHDVELGVRCVLDAISPTEAACRPPGLGDDFIAYADDACTASVLAVSSGGPVPTLASERRACRVDVYAVGSATSHPRTRLEPDGRCVALEQFTDVRWFELTRRDVAHALRTRAGSDRRLAPIAIQAGGRALYDTRLFDRESGEECAITADFSFPDPRCRPIAPAPVRHVFRDVSCTELTTFAVLADSLDDCGSAGPPRFALDLTREPRHHRIGAPHVGPVFERLDPCVEIAEALPPLHELGDLVPDSYFVGGEIVTDP